VLDRTFEASAPNRKWIADFTYVWTAEGWLYVAAVIDLFSRRVVGWSMRAAMTAQRLAVGRAWRDEAEGRIGRSSMAQVFAYVSTASIRWIIQTRGHPCEPTARSPVWVAANSVGSLLHADA
jgi:transposase InsO family protein